MEQERILRRPTLMTKQQIQDMKNADPLNYFRPQSIYEYYHNNNTESSSEDEDHKTFEEEKVTPKESLSYSNTASTSSIQTNSIIVNKRKSNNPTKLIKVKTPRTKTIAPKIIYDSTGRRIYLNSYTKEEIIVAHALILLKNRPVNTAEERSKKENKYATIDELSSDTDCAQSSSSSIPLKPKGKRLQKMNNVVRDDISETTEYPQSSSSSGIISEEELSF